jgi:hypothetical protein
MTVALSRRAKTEISSAEKNIPEKCRAAPVYNRIHKIEQYGVDSMEQNSKEQSSREQIQHRIIKS